jgi:dipeptidyl aminopeptidase/acylaminoacyl peptidase
MRKTSALLATLLLVPLAEAQGPARQERGTLIYDGIPATDAALGGKLHAYLHSRRAVFLDWLPDGGMLVATRFGDTEQVHRLAAPLGMREQLTFHPEPVGTAVVPQVAGAEGFLFLKDRGGDENSQIHYFRHADRSVRLLTDGKSLHGGPIWSHDGKRFAYYSNARDGVGYDIYVMEMAQGATPRLVVGAQKDNWKPLDWSPDDQKLLVQREVSINEGYLFIVDAWSGIVTPLDTTGRKVGIKAAKFAPDGRGVLIASDVEGEFATLRHFDPATGESRALTPDRPWDVESFDASADGRYIAYVRNEDGYSRLTILDNQTKLELTPPGVPDARIGELRFDRAGKRLAFSAESAQSPRDVYVYDLERNALDRWTRSEVGPIDARKLVAPQLIHYPTWDRVDGKPRRISAYLYRPRGSGPHPVVINIHGGPESQYQPGFDPLIQFLVQELGIAVIAPNVRGSAGYGKSFLKLDNGMLREGAVKDIGSLLVWIGVQPDLDRDRVVTMGGSYGGYMSLASLAAYSDRLRGAVDVVGISNFVTFLNNTAPYRRDLRRAEYGDERDPRMRAFLSRISPLNNVGAMRRPLLVVQGLNDPRVPATESEQMVAVLRAKGGEVWYLAAKDEGHGFRKKGNRDAYYETVAAFLLRLNEQAR